MKGFSLNNLKYIKQWYTFWQKEIFAKQPASQLEFENSQQALAHLTQIPWGHNIVIISKSKNPDEDITCISETYHKWRSEPTPSPSQEGNITSGSFQVGNVYFLEGIISEREVYLLPGKGKNPSLGRVARRDGRGTRIYPVFVTL